MGDGFSRGPYRPSEELNSQELAQQLSKTFEAVQEGMRSVEMTLRLLVRALGHGDKLPTLPANYFLNEAHETHVTKSQARRERAELKKRQAEGKAVRNSRVARKPGSGRLRRR